MNSIDVRKPLIMTARSLRWIVPRIVLMLAKLIFLELDFVAAT
jgi:hypothetical protein